MEHGFSFVLFLIPPISFFKVLLQVYESFYFFFPMKWGIFAKTSLSIERFFLLTFLLIAYATIYRISGHLLSDIKKLQGRVVKPALQSQIFFGKQIRQSVHR
jgi:hypothetical protein